MKAEAKAMRDNVHWMMFNLILFNENFQIANRVPVVQHTFTISLLFFYENHGKMYVKQKMMVFLHFIFK